jgi:hypothetical protein
VAAGHWRPGHWAIIRETLDAVSQRSRGTARRAQATQPSRFIPGVPDGHFEANRHGALSWRATSNRTPPVTQMVTTLVPLAAMS